MYEFVLLFGMFTNNGDLKIESVAEFQTEIACVTFMDRLKVNLYNHHRPAVTGEMHFSCLHRIEEVEI